MTLIFRTLLAGLALAGAGIAQASDRSATVIPVTGTSGDCGFYASKQVVKQMGSSKLSPLKTGGTINLTGTDNPFTPRVGTESARLLGSLTNVRFENSTTPVDFTVLRSSSNVMIHYYPAGGVTSDSNLQLLVKGVPVTIVQVSLCYGLGNLPNEPEDEPPQEPISMCPINTNNCPDDGERRLLCEISLDDSGEFSGGVTSENCCMCNGEPLQACDPGLLGGQPGTCLGPSATGAAEVPTTLELNEDPYVCTTSGGTRTCYKY